VKSAHKELSDPKQFKADLTGPITKHEALADQVRKVFESVNKLEQQRDAAEAKARQQMEAKKAANDAARSKIVDVTQATSAAMRKVLDNASDWTTPVGPLAAKYDDLLKKYAASQKFGEKAEAEFEAVQKSLATKVDAASAGAEKFRAALQKSRKALTDQLNAYTATAQKIGNKELATRLSVMVGLLNPPGGGMGGY
jgi:chromosome segregation ATPase